MAGFAFDRPIVQFKAYFSDRANVQAAVNKTILSKLNYIGGYVRTVVKNSIRKAKGRHSVSVAGKPPLGHIGLFKKNIFFAIEPERDSVIIGPALLNAKGQNVPETLEFGGSTVIYSHKKRKKVTIKARPYMQPALEHSQNKIAQIWANSIKK
jgi:hypothetical protein